MTACACRSVRDTKGRRRPDRTDCPVHGRPQTPGRGASPVAPAGLPPIRLTEAGHVTAWIVAPLGLAVLYRHAPGLAVIGALAGIGAAVVVSGGAFRRRIEEAEAVLLERLQHEVGQDFAENILCEQDARDELAARRERAALNAAAAHRLTGGRR